MLRPVRDLLTLQVTFMSAMRFMAPIRLIRQLLTIAPPTVWYLSVGERVVYSGGQDLCDGWIVPRHHQHYNF